MNEEIFKNTMGFMNRVQLQGAEVPAFNQCMAELMRQHAEWKKCQEQAQTEDSE